MSLGHGIGLRKDHFTELLESGLGEGVDWFEIISENFFPPGGRPWAILDEVRKEVPIVMHGVSMGIGDPGPVPEPYMAELIALMERVEPAIVSDHLCWCGYGGETSHDLLPLPYTEEALAHVSRKVEQVQDRLGRRFVLENPSSYLTFCASTIPEHEFMSALVDRTGCGLLLDVNNVYVSSKNHGFDPIEYIRAMPKGAVEQIHLAGHTDHGWFLLDSHIGPVPDPVWDLYGEAVRHLGAVPTLVEWDDEIPPYAEVAAEAACARALEARVLKGGG